MSALSPLGAARRKFLLAAGPATEREEPLEWDDDFEPAYLGWEIARCAPGLSPELAAGVSALAAACIAVMRAGSTRMSVERGALASALALAGAPAALPVALAALSRARERGEGDPVSRLIGAPGERKPLILDGGWLYAERMRVLEDRFTARVRERLAHPVGGRDPRRSKRAVAAVSAGPPPLTDEQKRAVQQALAAPFALITGAPGTGKTTIVVALVRALAWLGERLDGVAIAAPTGKAAQRLQESIGTGLASPARDMADVALREAVPPPQTLHRLLGWSPGTGRFAHHENDPLPHRVVIVDEASMIDLAMMDRLVRALRSDASLILLGDADQLPSVEAGAVFRDLCSALGAVRLTVNLRVAREPNARRLVAAAGAVNAGRLDGAFADAVATRRAIEEVRFEGVEHLAAPWDAVGDAVLDAWWRLRLAAPAGLDARALLDLYLRSRILCATRASGAASVEAINDSLLSRLNGGRSPMRRRWRAARPTAGAPIVIERNDYDRQLFNGDQGVAVRADDADGSGLVAVFRRGASLDTYPLDALRDVSAGFAMTVHKAQGSEFDDVLVVLPDKDIPLLTRELVYTAITRARRSVLIVGERELLARAVSRVVERHSGIAEKLRASIR